MKLYRKTKQPDIMWVNIKKQGEKTFHIPVCEVMQNELLLWLKDLIQKQELSIFAEGRKITIEVREKTNGKNGKVASFSFRGLSTIKTNELILKNIQR